jgi:hypothetical protein
VVCRIVIWPDPAIDLVDEVFFAEVCAGKPTGVNAATLVSIPPCKNFLLEFIRFIF